MIQRTYAISQVLDLKDSMVAQPDITCFVGQELSKDIYDDFISAVHRRLPKNIRREVIHESLLHLAGHDLTAGELHDNVWRLAGNVPRLRASRAVPPWNVQVDDEYVPVQILSLTYCYTKGREPGCQAALIVLAGTPCPMVLEKTWSKRFCRVLARRIGFTSSWGAFPFRDTRELVNLRFYAKIEKKLSGKIPDFQQFWQDDEGKRARPSSVISYNREVLLTRRRDPEVFTCPMEFPRSHRCYLCYVGLDECSAAVHDVSFVKQLCEQCKKTDWFDPASPSKVCIRCHNLNLRKL